MQVIKTISEALSNKVIPPVTSVNFVQVSSTTFTEIVNTITSEFQGDAHYAYYGNASTACVIDTPMGLITVTQENGIVEVDFSELL
jgi:hypothetical protein